MSNTPTIEPGVRYITTSITEADFVKLEADRKALNVTRAEWIRRAIIYFLKS